MHIYFEFWLLEVSVIYWERNPLNLRSWIMKINILCDFSALDLIDVVVINLIGIGHRSREH